MKPYPWPTYALILIGIGQSFFFLVGNYPLSRISAITVASPLPLVFSSFKGVDTFALQYDLKLCLMNGQKSDLKLERDIYARMRGPFLLRNAYGAAFSYGPYFERIKEKDLTQSILSFAFCSPAPLANELGIKEKVESGELTVTDRLGVKTKLGFRCK